ncbi:hypothetical protein [Winogradskyella flava]|uniref:hypothetical protein n=1 Tax=Winogradskyella flava TaxID=1884876 RepID=UPI00248F64C1|nr:hypothetical protein [Winogradskyella flava]
MNIKNFITNRKSIEKLTTKMIQIESDGWETKYIDGKDKSEWIKVQLDSEYYGGGSPILFRLPRPTQSELIKILIESTDLNQISAISSLIKGSEFDASDNHNEYREKLIIELEKIVNDKDFKWNSFEKKRLTTIINDSDLNFPHNQRESLGKKYNEVESDYQYYKNIAERAEKIITIANNGYNSLWRNFLRKIPIFK